MANFPLLITGEASVGTSSPTQLPDSGGQNPWNSGQNVVAGQGVQVILKSPKANTAPIYYGGSNVATSGTHKGATLDPGDLSPPIIVNDLNMIYVISGSSGQVVDYTVTNAP